LAIVGDSAGGISPFTAADSETHAYLMAGTYELRLTVRDDDGGMTDDMVIIVIE